MPHVPTNLMFAQNFDDDEFLLTTYACAKLVVFLVTTEYLASLEHPTITLNPPSLFTLVSDPLKVAVAVFHKLN